MTDDLLAIPDFLRRPVEPPKPDRRKDEHPGRRLVIPKPKPVKYATKAQVKALVDLGWNRVTAKLKKRDVAAELVLYQVRPN